MSRALFRTLQSALAALATACSGAPGGAATLLFAEDFENVPLQTSPTYGVPGAFSPDPPAGWDTVDLVPPGGVPEWEGWSFANKTFWQNIGAAFGDQPGRGHFQRGQGVVAVADSDLWNQPPNYDPANREGFYNTFLISPIIDLDNRQPDENRLRLAFDSSWMGIECCDDGEFLDSELRHHNNQTAVVRVRVGDGPPVEVLRWESAPYYDGLGRPSSSPTDVTGAPNTPNPFYRPFNLDERFYLDLTDLVDPPGGLGEGFAGIAAAMSSGGGGVQIEFGMEGAGDDGWWGVDNIEMGSYGAVLGDMNLSGDLDVGDYDAFALGMLDTDAYRAAYWGTFPAENGSLDSVFDFDDIPWFLSVMEGVGAPSTAYAMAFFSVPEPSTAMLAGAAMLAVVRGRRLR